MIRTILTVVVVGCLCSSSRSEELDYYRHLRYPSKLVPGVGRNQVEQEGGANPYLGKQAANLYHFQRSLKYHTTADWDYRTQAERKGELPAKTKKWLQRVRGY